MTPMQQSYIEETLDAVVADTLKVLLQQLRYIEITVDSVRDNRSLYETVIEALKDRTDKTPDMLIAEGFAYLGSGLYIETKGTITHPTGSPDPEEVGHMEVGSTSRWDYGSAISCFTNAGMQNQFSYLGKCLVYRQLGEYQNVFRTAGEGLRAIARSPLMWALYAEAGDHISDQRADTPRRINNTEFQLSHTTGNEKKSQQYILANLLLADLKRKQTKVLVYTGAGK